MRKIFHLFVFLLLALNVSDVCAQGSGKTMLGRAVRIVDGDTFDFLSDSVVYRIRLAGIDCPEKGQAFSQKAKEALSRWCLGKLLKIVVSSKDRNGRLIGDVFASNQEWLNLWMIRQGFAWHFKNYSSNHQLATAETHARTKKLGLWKDPNPVAPWLWRSRNKYKKRTV